MSANETQVEDLDIETFEVTDAALAKVLEVRSEEDNPEEKLGNEELKELLKSALHTLSERETLVIQLYYIEELNVFEIAEVMEISTGRVSQIKKSAIANLRSFITNAQHVR